LRFGKLFFMALALAPAGGISLVIYIYFFVAPVCVQLYMMYNMNLSLKRIFYE
jgi:hypothetical protein